MRGRRLRALLVAVGAAVVWAASPTALPAAQTLPRLPIDSAAHATSDPGRRPFAHQRHEALPCRGCHGSGATHRVTYIRTPRDCAACHHDPDRGLECTRCHTGNALPATRTVAVDIRLASGGSPRHRDIEFRHSPHLEARANLRCTSCHTTPVTMSRGVECASCHGSHHEGAAECARCHKAPPRAGGPHNAAVHLSCSGGSCHAAGKAPSPTAGRAVCLFCHDDRRSHEPDGTCAVCHRIPGSRTAGGGAGGRGGHAP